MQDFPPGLGGQRTSSAIVFHSVRQPLQLQLVNLHPTLSPVRVLQGDFHRNTGPWSTDEVLRDEQRLVERKGGAREDLSMK